MDTKRLYVDFHVLQTVPPSCVNRDDTGSPKTTVYGGAVRARVSSQAWKHAMRVMFTEEMSGEVEIGKRTLRAIDLVADELAELLPGQDRKKLEKMSQDALKRAGITFKKSDKKDGEKSDNTSALLLIGKAQATALAKLAAENCKDDSAYEDALNENPTVDMVLFGRMVASAPSLNYDAAAQMAHSISTHTVQNEFDYFTAVDDCAPEDNAGAGHLGTVEYNSATLYRAMRRSMFWSWCARWAQSRRHRQSGRSVRRSSAPCPPASRTALPTALCRMPFTSPCGRTSR